MTWEAFVLAYGFRARTPALAHIVGQPVAAVAQLRRTQAGTRLAAPLGFAELFARWHGRPPADADWPPPQRAGRGRYEWQAPELALLARLVGTMGKAAIADALTTRLRTLTGDPAARRSVDSVQIAIQRLGLVADDVVGGLTIRQAAARVGSRMILHHEIRAGRLTAFRVGRLLVIPHEAFDRWAAGRVFPPAGFVPLASLRHRLGLKSDKLSEFARAGHIPTAVRCNPCGTGTRGTKFGTWWVSRATARQLLADRRAGRPMPWHGQPITENLQRIYRLWTARRHPATCAACQAIWGPAGAPADFAAFAQQYPPLVHGAKRHLTWRYTAGLTRAAAAQAAGVPLHRVLRAIAAGLLRTTGTGRRARITRTDLTRWTARRCPTGTSQQSWLSLATAARLYAFTVAELRQSIAEGRLQTRVCPAGPARGQTQVAKQQCRELRDTLGYTLAQAAARVGVSVPRLRVLLRALQWRPAPRLDAATLDAAKKRQASAPGLTIAEAARHLGRPRHWVQAEIDAGTIRTIRAPWNPRRVYVSPPMLRRLEAAARDGRVPQLSADWLQLGPATELAGVSAATLAAWAAAGEVLCTRAATWRRFHRRSVMARARRYWTTEARFRRRQPPAWLATEAAA